MYCLPRPTLYMPRQKFTLLQETEVSTTQAVGYAILISKKKKRGGGHRQKNEIKKMDGGLLKKS